MKRIILCADDFGQTHSITEGILQLVTNQRLNAVSCMVDYPKWKSRVSDLPQANSQVAIGLHFNLTEGPEALGSLPKVIIGTHLKRISKTVIAASFARQLKLFVEGLGRLPDFIDGHQHIQHLPIVREVILDWFRQARPEPKPYLRLSYSSLQDFWQQPWVVAKGVVINLMGAWQFKKDLVSQGIPHNTHFAGIYNFKQASEYRNIFPKMLQGAHEGTLIMCHPGLASPDPTDALAGSRHYEFAYLNSEAFLEDCAQYQVCLF